MKVASGIKPEQAQILLVWDPASQPLAGTKPKLAPTPAASAGPAGPPQTQGTDSDVEMQDAPAAAKNEQNENENENENKNKNKKTKLPTVYGARDPSVKITAERVDVPEDAATNEPARLLIKFKNLDLKGKGKEKQQGLAPKKEDDSESDEDDEGDNDGHQTTGGKQLTGGKNKKGRK